MLSEKQTIAHIVTRFQSEPVTQFLNSEGRLLVVSGPPSLACPDGRYVP